MRVIDRDRLYRVIGNRVKQARDSRKPRLTQGELAEMLGVERTSITNIEKGTQRATLHFLYSLAQQLQIPLVQLFPSLDDEEILEPEETTAIAELKLGKQTRPVPKYVKSFVEKL